MTEYEISYRSFFSNRKFNITENGNPAGGFERSWMGGAGTISLGNVPYTVTRESLLGGVYFIETGGTRVATARKPNMMHRTFAIESSGKTYMLEARRMGGKRFALREDGREVGKAETAGFFGRRFILDFPDEVPRETKALFIWLYVNVNIAEVSQRGESNAST
ncbi:MAG TPA: hypothetical protein VH206_18445 [Xanthobacteraceae bacterium]|nr:hypothetical protein [Xanthobacteraceae bacterium]